MINKNITFIGVGHISHAIIDGLLKAKTVDKDKIILSGPHLERFNDLGKKYGLKTTTNNIEAVKNAEIVFIGVRPKVVEKVAGGIKTHLKSDALIISIAAGVTFDLLHKYFSAKEIKLVKVIPNIPVAYGLGVVGWVGDYLTVQDKTLVKSLLKPLGLIIECKDEKTLDKLSMISGCGIGYVAYFMKNLEKIAKSYGLNEDDVSKIVLNTFTGTVKHLSETGESPEKLTSAVATKGGITEEVLKSMEEGGFSKLFSESVKKGYDKIGEL
ncbi:hypothetical protein A2960_02740 [Candidatus Gottesmanbacteria bacterium RIFCSPLOWO2_01_FULL_39_12b]|uniref:Pyrroline-5-carboxylate reductase n=1 Tax=Candidatus Gottesmanbacteria bacterium RIFCSPLOWO2_01_FULL_39_12b TaxID=1798388 RepID=A0A1F6AQU7_9BACT|nr:MAG: hypothetical protein A2960_02740 [Candidatus Gottesmanbacteria bacterium RIFCSPLOWO2_01_FULL_39_12b]